MANVPTDQRLTTLHPKQVHLTHKRLTAIHRRICKLPALPRKSFFVPQHTFPGVNDLANELLLSIAQLAIQSPSPQPSSLHPCIQAMRLVKRSWFYAVSPLITSSFDMAHICPTLNETQHLSDIMIVEANKKAIFALFQDSLFNNLSTRSVTFLGALTFPAACFVVDYRIGSPIDSIFQSNLNVQKLCIHGSSTTSGFYASNHQVNVLTFALEDLLQVLLPQIQPRFQPIGPTNPMISVCLVEFSNLPITNQQNVLMYVHCIIQHSPSTWTPLYWSATIYTWDQ